jgi:hypothetical protein
MMPTVMPVAGVPAEASVGAVGCATAERLVEAVEALDVPQAFEAVTVKV